MHLLRRSVGCCICLVAALALSFSVVMAGEKKEAVEASNIQTVESYYQGLNDFRARFTQSTEVKLLGKSLVKKGSFLFKKGGKWRIEYDAVKSSSNPEDAGKLYICDGKTLWIKIPNDESSLQTFAVNDDSVPKEALSLMDGFGKLSKEFAISPSTAFRNMKEGQIALKLKPQGKAKHYEMLEALFTVEGQLVQLIVRNTSGNVSDYLFSDYQTNKNLKDAIFTLSSGKATPDTLPQ